MKSVRIALHLLVLCASLWAQNASAQDRIVLFEQVKPSVVVVETEGRPLVLNGPEPSAVTPGLGSGVFIGDRRVLTAAHVVQAEDSIAVRFHDGQEIGAKVISSSQQADVALLELKKKPRRVTPAQIADSDRVKVGEPITTLLNVPQPVALLVQRVASGSLGSKLKLQGGYLPVPLDEVTLMLGGDIVLEVAGMPIEGPESGAKIREKLASLKKRDTVSVTVLRKGQRVQLKCKL